MQVQGTHVDLEEVGSGQRCRENSGFRIQSVAQVCVRSCCTNQTGVRLNILVVGDLTGVEVFVSKLHYI